VREWLPVLVLAVGGLLVAWVLPEFWARVVIPVCIVAFVLLTRRERRRRRMVKRRQL
jgi:hypothetical protein